MPPSMTSDKIRIAHITALLPAGHYSEILTNASYRYASSLTTVVYADRNKANLKLSQNGDVRLTWRKGWKFFYDVYRALKKDKPQLIHLQHEFNMYGGLFINLFLPWFCFFLRMMIAPVVVTIHGVVSPVQINNDFKHFFSISVYIPLWVLKCYFFIFYSAWRFGGSELICHTGMMKHILIDSYHIPEAKLTVIPPIVPEKNKCASITSEQIFLYYGYLVRRKGLEELLRGFAHFIQKHPGYRLILAGGVIAGQESASQELKSLVTTLKMSRNVEFYGFVKTESELQQLYAKAAAIVIPAHLSIAASGPLYHARGYGSAILASDLDNLGEEIRLGDDAYLVKKGEWAKALSHIATGQINLVNLRKKTESVAKKYHGSVLIKHYEKLYKSLLQD